MRKIGGLIAVVLMALLVIVGCDNSTVTNDDNGEWINHINNIIANGGSSILPDQSWYDEDATGSQTYKLSNESELFGLMYLVSSGTDDFADDTIELVEDAVYDLSSISSVMKGTSSFIGSGDRKGSASAFAGTFNGNGATIKNATLNFMTSKPTAGDVAAADEDNTAIGFFGVVKGTEGKHAVIYDLVFENCDIYSTSNTAGVAIGYAEYADISDITVQNCTIRGPQGVGGVVGRLYKGGKIENCKSINNNVIVTADIIHYYDASNPALTGNYNAGGIVGAPTGGTASSIITITGNTVRLDAGYEISATEKYAGGISGQASGYVTFSGNTVEIADSNQITSSEGGHCGAIAGYAAGSNITYDASGDNTINIGNAGPVTVTSTNDDMSAITQP